MLYVSLNPAFGFFKILKFSLVAAERGRVIETSAVAVFGRVKDVEHFVEDDVFDDKFRHFPVVERFTNNHGFVRRIVMPEDADVEKGLISVSSPIGKAIVNKEAGDEVIVQTPSGRRDFEITRLTTIHDME